MSYTTEQALLPNECGEEPLSVHLLYPDCPVSHDRAIERISWEKAALQCRPIQIAVALYV
jgi:hypothetical protein